MKTIKIGRDMILDIILTGFVIIIMISLASAAQVKFIAVGDPHVDDTGESGHEELQQIVDEINTNTSYSDLNFVVFLGDIANDNEDIEYQTAKNILDNLTKPYHVVPGNHDLRFADTQGIGIYNDQNESWTVLSGQLGVDYDYNDKQEGNYSLSIGQTQYGTGGSIQQNFGIAKINKIGGIPNESGYAQVNESKISIGETTITYDHGSPSSDPFYVNDYIMIEKEVMKIVNVDTSNKILTVIKAQNGSIESGHENDDDIWKVTIVPYNNDSPLDPFYSSDYIKIDNEIMRVGYRDVSNNSVLATRRQKGTSTAIHNNGITMQQIRDLSGYKYIELWLLTERLYWLGPPIMNEITLMFGESNVTEQQYNVSNGPRDIWRKIRWDITGIPDTSKDRITKFGIKINVGGIGVLADNIIVRKEHYFENYFPQTPYMQTINGYQFLFTNLWDENTDLDDSISPNKDILHWDFDFNNLSINKSIPVITFLHGAVEPNNNCDWNNFYTYGQSMKPKLREFTGLKLVNHGHVHTDTDRTVDGIRHISFNGLVDGKNPGSCAPGTKSTKIGYIIITNNTVQFNRPNY